MQTLQTTSLRVSENQLFILDQQALPQEKRWLAAEVTVRPLAGGVTDMLPLASVLRATF